MNRRPDVLCISSIDWDFIWQGHQEIMATLASQGHRVLFLENTGVRSPGVRDLPRVRQRMRNWWKGTKGFREERPNLFVYSPLLVPLPYSRVARWLNRFLLLRSVRRWMRAIGFFRPIIWTFLPTPLTLDLINDLDPQLIVYYCIDDFASSSPGARRIVASEARLFGTADLVFVTSEKLRDRAARHSTHVHRFPFGVNVELFDRVRLGGEPPPADLRALRRPVIGYVGGLHQWVDQALIADVASRMPDATFALVGPAQTDVSTLARCPNVHLLGRRSHADVPGYIKGFDVGIVPYRLTEYTANVYPTKLNEYLVMGVPVVASDLPEIRRFNADHDGVVQVAGDAAAFAAAVRGSLNGSSRADMERRVAAAHTNSWPSRIAAMNLLIDEAVERRAASRQRWDETLRRVYRRARTHIAQVVLTLTAASVLVFYSPLVWWLAAPLKIDQPPQRADAIVVFAAGVGESATAGGGEQERLKQAIDLYKAGSAPYLVFSSGFLYSYPEAEIMRALAIDQGIPAGAIVLEQRSANTYQMVLRVGDILGDRHWTSILLVSSPYHMRRATMVWRKVAPGVRVIPVPPPRTQFYDHDWGASLDQVGGILWEYAAIADYWRRGWL